MTHFHFDLLGRLISFQLIIHLPWFRQTILSPYSKAYSLTDGSDSLIGKIPSHPGAQFQTPTLVLSIGAMHKVILPLLFRPFNAAVGSERKRVISWQTLARATTHYQGYSCKRMIFHSLGSYISKNIDSKIAIPAFFGCTSTGPIFLKQEPPFFFKMRFMGHLSV